MKSECSEKDIALYVENDLPELQRFDLEAHLEQCEACAALAAELRESQLVFKSLRSDMVNATALAEVRGKILNQVAAARPPRFWFLRLRRGFALAGVALFVVVLMNLWREPKDPPARTVGMVSDRPVRSETAPTVVKHVRNTKARRHRNTKAVPPEQKQVVVKLLTDDPNIVIYWLVDQNGGEQ